jgi:hypothetical protein
MLASLGCRWPVNAAPGALAFTGIRHLASDICFSPYSRRHVTLE